MKHPNSIKLSPIKLVIEDFEVEYNLGLSKEVIDSENKLNEINELLDSNNNNIAFLNKRIDKLTNKADNIDYIIAMFSGILSGIIDSIWVGEFNFERGKKWSNEKTNKFVTKTAQKFGYKGDDLNGAIKHLEKKFPLASDSNTADFGGGYQHHLRDFSHHPTILGLFFSMLTQFTGKSFGTDTLGYIKVIDVKNKVLIGKSIHEKLLFGAVFWFFHMVSDIAGSSSNPGAGTGLPGPLLSFAKKLSTLPIFRNIRIGDNSLSLTISKLFNGTLLAERDSNGKIIKESVKRFDFRAELGIGYEISRQFLPIIVNECIVRGFYFIRRLTDQFNAKKITTLSELYKIDWKNTIPFRNKTIIRMLSIATTTFSIIDLSDAAIRSLIKSRSNIGGFAKEFGLRINIVGIGRIFIAIGTDFHFEVEKEKTINARIAAINEHLYLMNAKTYYLQNNMWESLKQTEQYSKEIELLNKETVNTLNESLEANRVSMENITEYIDTAKRKNINEDLFFEISKILKN